jgi:hypothetical protein
MEITRELATQQAGELDYRLIDGVGRGRGGRP